MLRRHSCERVLVIPAQAGIQSAVRRLLRIALDFRLRGNDAYPSEPRKTSPQLTCIVSRPMTNALTSERIDRWALPLGLVVIIALVIVFAGWTGPELPSAAINAIWLLITSGFWVMAWLAAALGLGWPLRMLLVPCAKEGLAIQIGLGVAGMLVLDAALGPLGLLQLGGSIGA